MNKTIIEINDNNIDYCYRQCKKIQNIKNLEIIFITIFILIFSFVIAILQYFDYKPYKELSKFKRIKYNMSNWKNNIIEKTNIEITKGKRLSLELNNNSIYNFLPIDFGIYYTAMRLNNKTYLPEFIRRGTGDVWKINKADKNDKSAFQLTKYIIMQYSDNYITCGVDMYDKLGYGGYFNKEHPCQIALDSLKNKFI